MTSTTATATRLVKPVRCRRCAGTGTYSAMTRRTHRGVPGLCLRCDGTGVVEGDRATLAAAKAEAERREARWWAAVEWFGTQPRDVKEAFDVLEFLDRERADRCLDSIVAGHPGVTAALRAYAADPAVQAAFAKGMGW